jgi:hypothetical protein
MQQLTVSERSLLMGDHVADLLLAYAALLGSARGADTVSVRVIASDGAHETMRLLLNAASRLLAEPSPSRMPEPDNAVVEAYLQRRIDSYAFDERDLQRAAEQGEADGGVGLG